MEHGDMEYESKGSKMKMDQDYSSKGGGKNAGYASVAEVGFKCKGKYPLKSKFYQKESKHGVV